MAAFTFNINRKVQVGLITCGKFDGSHACMVAATSAGNIIIHNPHRQLTLNPTDSQQEALEKRLEWNGEFAQLEIGQQILSLCTGRLNEDERDILLIGTLTHVLAYQIEENADLFNKPMSEGAYAMIVGKLNWIPNHVAVIGGNSSITILDCQGIELFWIVMGDIVRSLAILDFNGDGENELICGSDDYEIKVIKGDLVLWETKETAPVNELITVSGKQFAYVVANGTVGVYEGGTRLWRIKSKHKVTTIKSYDTSGSGKQELITGWSSGKIDVRSATTGEVLFKLQFNNPIGGIIDADYRRTGRNDLIIVSTAGEVRGYGIRSMITAPETGEVIKKLVAKRHALQTELRQRKTPNQNFIGTKLAFNMYTGNGAVRLAFASGPGLFIHFVIVFAEGFFDGETLVCHPKKPIGQVEIELKPDKNTPLDIHIKVAIGTPDSDLFQVLEIVRQLPRFSMYEMISKPDNLPLNFKENGVIFEIADRPQRVALWLNQNFLLAKEFDVTEDAPKSSFIEIWLHGMRDNNVHCIRASAVGKASIQTNDPDFAGDIIKSLTSYLGIQELSSEARFPAQEKKLEAALEQIKGLKEVDARLQADAAGDLTILKNLVIRLEDARILEDVQGMRKKLFQLNRINEDLMREYEIRLNSNREFASTLKELNVGVRYASKLRVGRASTNAVSRCRIAIQDENPKALIEAFQTG